MIRFNAVLVASILLLGGVAGCQREESNEAVVTTPAPVRKNPNKAKGDPNAATEASPGANPAGKKTPAGKASPPKAAPAGTTASPPPARVKQAFTKLNGYLPAAVNKLKANDVETAKQYAQDFNANWQQLQNLVKGSSPASHKQISDGVTQVTNTLIKPAQPDKTKAIASLQNLSKAVTQFAKSP